MPLNCAHRIHGLGIWMGLSLVHMPWWLGPQPGSLKCLEPGETEVRVTTSRVASSLMWLATLVGTAGRLYPPMVSPALYKKSGPRALRLLI